MVQTSVTRNLGRIGFVAVLVAVIAAVAVPNKAEAAGGIWDFENNNLGLGGNLGLGVASLKVGVGFQFGLNARLRLYKGLYMDPGWHMYLGRVGEGDHKTSVWMMTMTPSPVYVFRFRHFPLHPYGGFCPTFNICHAGSIGGAKAETKVRVGLALTFGGEWLVTPDIGLYEENRFHMVFGEGQPDVFSFTAGMLYYLD